MFCFCFMSHVLSAVKNMVGGTSYLQIISALNKDTSKEMSRKLKLKNPNPIFTRNLLLHPGGRKDDSLPRDWSVAQTQAWLVWISRDGSVPLQDSHNVSLLHFHNTVLMCFLSILWLKKHQPHRREALWMSYLMMWSVLAHGHTLVFDDHSSALSRCVCVCVCCPSGDSSTFCVCVFLPDLSRVTWHHCWICAGRCCVKAVFCGVSFTISKQRWQCLPLQSSLSWIRSFDHA